MPNKREYPFDPKMLGRLRHLHSRQPQMAHRPLSNIEALMRMPPGDSRLDISTSLTPIFGGLELKEVVGRAIDALPPEDRYIVEQLLVQGNSLRKLGFVLGIPKTSLARRRDKIRQRLVEELNGNPVIDFWKQT